MGGHSGDATPAAKLIASTCDTLFVHPNVVNASDINEMTENMLYVEGSILNGFLDGKHALEKVHNNKILLAVNSPVSNEIINAASGARATIGADIEIVELDTPIRMIACMINGKASGDIHGLKEAVYQVRRHDFDVLVVNTPIGVRNDAVLDYLNDGCGGVNPWGGIEAKLSRLMSEVFKRPVIHAPVENSEVFKNFNDVVDARKAAEMVSKCYLHCCLKGAHRAPKISMKESAYWNRDIDFLISPINVVGRPHLACIENNIPVIAVRENKTVLNDKMPDNFIIAENYLEAAGIINAKKAGVTIASVRRPLERTRIINIS